MVPSLENFRDSKRKNFMSQLAKLFATRKPALFHSFLQCCGSKYIEMEPGS